MMYFQAALQNPVISRVKSPISWGVVGEWVMRQKKLSVLHMSKFVFADVQKQTRTNGIEYEVTEHLTGANI